MSSIKQYYKISLYFFLRHVFYFTLKAIFVLEIYFFNFLSRFFGQIEKRIDLKDKVSFKIYDVTT